ncbi:hypothetical protein CBER1_10369 [Cercospora berteroae]|uniref:Acyltransferase 3 domain-containing protein n=1 Tax=Cercospora berteroae TaxID=357750 RepID=A0A2S6BXL3_9PEZI|nr:hypothetical protein CBER1_10369 [Cercospora berteroae]
MVCFSSGIAKRTEAPGVVEATYLGNPWHWICETMRLIDPFPHVTTHWRIEAQGGHYQPQLWTIPVEFKGSMFLFLFCAAVCKMNARKWGYVTLATSVACFWYQTAYAGLFLFGMWLADRQLGRANHEQVKLTTLTTCAPDADDSAVFGKLEHDLSEVEEAGVQVVTGESKWSDWTHFLRNGGRSPSTLPTKFKFLRQLPYMILAYLGIIFLAAPDIITTDMRFPYNIGAMLMPPTYKDSWAAKNDWPQAIGALFLSHAMEHSSLLRRPLETPFSQFVGELSFGIYAMHNTVRWIVWEQYFEPWTVRTFGETRRDIWLILPGYFAMTLLVIWAAEGFRRVDMRCVDLARRMKDHLFAD